MKNLVPWKKQSHEGAGLRRDFNNLMERFFSETFPKLLSDESWYPSVDVSEGRKDIVVKAEIPGVEKENIDISLEGRLLTIRGEKKQEKEESNEHYHRVESSFGSYRRSIELPSTVDESKVEAKYKNGILRIKLPKAKGTETKKIDIKTAS
ncbi:MAG: Hsp20/alpha crystallin family protein [Desulfobacterales bacterium]